MEGQQFKGLISLPLCVMAPTTTPQKSIFTKGRSISNLLDHTAGVNVDGHGAITRH
jgi:hypothetical protein